MRPHGRARVDPSSPRAFATCDRCGFLYNRHDLGRQFEWSGPKLQDQGILVCDVCLDRPQEQFRTIVLPPDPVSISDPRPESYFIDETNFRVSESGINRRLESLDIVRVLEAEGSVWGNTDTVLPPPVIPPEAPVVWVGRGNRPTEPPQVITQSMVYDPLNLRFGGRVQRSLTDARIGGSLGGTLTLDHPLHAEIDGQMLGTIGEGGVYIGWFDSNSLQARNFIGWFIKDDGNLFVRTAVWTDNGRGAQAGVQIDMGVNSLLRNIITADYDPLAASGRGTLTITANATVAVFTLPVGFRAAGAHFDTFGMRNLWWNSATSVYIDYYLYSAAYTGVSGLITKDMQADPGWAGVNNNTVYSDIYTAANPNVDLVANQDFGASPTSWATTDNTDIGGIFVTSQPDAPAGWKRYYAAPLRRTYTFNTDWWMEGMVCLRGQNVDSDLWVGIFNEVTSVGNIPGVVPPGFMGLWIGGSTNNGHPVRCAYFTDTYADAIGILGEAVADILPPDSDKYPFRIDYTASSRRLAVAFNGGPERAITVTDAHYALGMTCNYFGWRPRTTAGGSSIEAYFGEMNWAGRV